MRDLLCSAEQIYDRTPALEAAARDVRGFGGGAAWMRTALGCIRMTEPTGHIDFASLGYIKYGAAISGALVVASLAIASSWFVLLAVLVFYAIEAQMVFLFPAAIDGASSPFTVGRALTVKAGGTARVMGTVIPIAAVMLFGGFFGRGFRRSWCIGCLAVCIWYERIRSS